MIAFFNLPLRATAMAFLFLIFLPFLLHFLIGTQAFFALVLLSFLTLEY
jgi:hypothetical protein